MYAKPPTKHELACEHTKTHPGRESTHCKRTDIFRNCGEAEKTLCYKNPPSRGGKKVAACLGGHGIKSEWDSEEKRSNTERSRERAVHNRRRGGEGGEMVLSA